MDELNYQKKKECECTVNYSENDISGKPTECYHHGEGVWQCPACATIFDHSDIVFKVIITYSIEMDDDEESYEIKLETDDARLHEAPDKKYPDSTNIKFMLDDIYDGIASGDIQFHEGKYETLILWNWYRCSYEYDEYDLEMAIVSEKKMGDDADE